MRRTEQEFKAEVLRRSEQYRAERKKRRQKFLTAAACFLMVFCGFFLMRPLLYAGGGSTESAAMDAAENIELEGVLYRNGSEMMEEEAAPQAAEPESPREMPAEDAAESKSGASPSDLIPMVMIDGVIYMDTGCNSTVEGRCGVMDGQITSQVNGNEQPTEDDQSNFGTGYGYQYGATEGTVEIYMNGIWRIFATEEVRREIQFPE